MPEFDSAKSLDQSRPKSIAAFLAEGGRPALWQPEELGAIFRHQMAAPALADLGAFDAATAARLRAAAPSQPRNFGDLLRDPAPPLEWLELTKQFAKANMDQPESPLPSEVAAVLYYAAIASALARLNRRITQLADADLRRGLRWARQQPWIDAPTVHLLDDALAKLPPEPPA